MLITKKTPPSKPSTVIEFDPVEWRARFNERAGQLQHEAAMTEFEANRQAGSEARYEWIVGNAPNGNGVSYCCHCGEGMDHNRLPMKLCGPSARVHEKCLVPFLETLIKKANEAMGENDFPRAAQAPKPYPKHPIDEHLDNCIAERKQK